MSEDLGTLDDPVVSLEHDWERRNWMRWLHCTEDELRNAVECAGPDPDNVRRFLRQAR
ncbi:MAG TPA: DUF3606 domain-containing protein [Ramlibacter sp.]|nr:DUF3606 domain-containing protein [Ramlibacter sp.]